MTEDMQKLMQAISEIDDATGYYGDEQCDCDICQSGGDCQAPHTHVYVYVDDHDECDICGRRSDQFADLPDEMHPDFEGGVIR